MKSPPLVESRSLSSVVFGVLGAGALAFGPAGCVAYQDDTHHHGGAMDDHWGFAAEATTVATIDSGELLDVEPGVGAGVFVEVEPDGVWHVYAGCDTAESGLACHWDVVMSVPISQRLELIEEEGLESNDEVWILDGGALRLLATTRSGFDGVRVRADPGQGVRFDLLLDGAPQPRFFNWVGDGAVQQGAPDLPIILVPSEG